VITFTSITYVKGLALAKTEKTRYQYYRRSQKFFRGGAKPSWLPARY